MDLQKLRIKDLSNGEIYKFTPEINKSSILEIHYCVSYFQFVVQISLGGGHYKLKDLIYIFDNANWVDLIAIREDEKCEIWFE
jgi:hypothetical protein